MTAVVRTLPFVHIPCPELAAGTRCWNTPHSGIFPATVACWISLETLNGIGVRLCSLFSSYFQENETNELSCNSIRLK